MKLLKIINVVTLCPNDFFTMVKWEVSGTLNYMKPREFCLVSVLNGDGQIIIDGEIFKIQKVPILC